MDVHQRLCLACVGRGSVGGTRQARGGLAASWSPLVHFCCNAPIINSVLIAVVISLEFGSLYGHDMPNSCVVSAWNKRQQYFRPLKSPMQS